MNEISIVLCGAAGQGIQTVEQLFSKIIKESGFFVFSIKEYMSRVRGGSNSTQIRISDSSIASFVDRIDILIVLDEHALDHVQQRVNQGTLVIGEKRYIKTSRTNRIVHVSFIDMAKEVGNPIYANSIAIGLLSSLINVKKEQMVTTIAAYFSKKDQQIIDNNIHAAKNGYELGMKLKNRFEITCSLDEISQIADQPYLFLNGAQSIGLGALAGGCNFIASYPMSPSTGVLSFLSQHADSFDLIAEQAEDEIAAINMGIGAWFAGARAMVTTSGGGFALMTEGVSLAGMIESPLVIHMAQRPGPATGLPTRTEQGDLFQVLYAGHGEFPRIIYAPGTLQEGYHLTKKAFAIADKYQIPVIILTDQYFIDSRAMTPLKEFDSTLIENQIVQSDESYLRYQSTSNGISPRAIPGNGSGFVCIDSDEHDEKGRITEDMVIRKTMNEKRINKLETIRKDALPPTFIGPKEYTYLLIGWGSTFHSIKQAMQWLNRPDVAFIHICQIYPLHPSLITFLRNAEKTFIIENNATGQLARLIRAEMGYQVDYQINKYNGLPFSVEEIQQKISDIIGGGP